MRTARDIPICEELERRFWRKVQRYEPTGCLLWMGKPDPQGYGHIFFAGKLYFAHRVSYCLHYQVVNLSPELELDHLCCVRPCVEWSHLEAVTHSVNNLRGRSPELARARRLRTHCPRGHALVGDNLLLQTQKGNCIRQRCRICTNARSRTYLKQWKLRNSHRITAGGRYVAGEE